MPRVFPYVRNIVVITNMPNNATMYEIVAYEAQRNEELIYSTIRKIIDSHPKMISDQDPQYQIMNVTNNSCMRVGADYDIWVADLQAIRKGLHGKFPETEGKHVLSN